MKIDIFSAFDVNYTVFSWFSSGDLSRGGAQNIATRKTYQNKKISIDNFDITDRIKQFVSLKKSYLILQNYRNYRKCSVYD